jgi:tetratricopeptide (TPR) repeat protein
MLTGRIVQHADTVTISVELIDTRSNRHLWGEQYNRKLSDLLLIQEDITKRISENLRLKLTGKDQEQLTKRYPDNAASYNLYLKGRFYWNKRTLEGYGKAIEFFNEALEIDPDYALAYAGLADTYYLIGDMREASPHQIFPKATAMAQKALEIDNTLAEAHASLAAVKSSYEWDWPGAEGEYHRAIELNSNYATAHQWYSLYLANMGRSQEALMEIKRAQELDPISLPINSDVGYVLYLNRQYDLAIEQEQKTIDMNPNFLWSHRNLGLIYEQEKMYVEAITQFQKVFELSNGRAGQMPLAHAYGVSGNRDGAQKILDKLKALEHPSPFVLAMVNLGLDNRDEALELLRKAFDERMPDMQTLKVEPRFDDLRSDPRFAAMLRRMNFPQ